jgi:hypothetical protein
MKIGNSSFEREEEFWYLRTTLTNHNSIQEGLAVILSSSLLAKNIKIKIYRTISFAYFVWVWNLVAHIEENIWT